MNAIVTDNIDAFKLLIEVGATMDYPDERGKTVLQYAREHVKQDIYHFLVDITKALQYGEDQIYNKNHSLRRHRNNRAIIKPRQH